MEWVDESPTRFLKAAAQLARQTTEREPNNAVAWQRLGEFLLETGDCGEAMAVAANAVRTLPDVPALNFLLAKSLEACGEFERAIEAVERYLLVRPDDRSAMVRRFELLARVTPGRALEYAAEAERIVPDHFALIEIAARRARREGRWRELLLICEEKLSAFPAHTSARYYRAIALNALSRPAEAARGADPDRFIAIRELPVPAAFSSGEAFRAALKDEILNNPTLTPDPRGKATYQGLQTGQLRQPGSRAAETLLNQIRIAVDEYVEAMGADADPFISARPGRVRLKSWAVVYTGAGRQNSHIHASGWLSGTYYVTAPEDPCGTCKGSLLVGGADESGASVPPFRTLRIAPVPGRLVMFPSWVPHATEATNAAEARICVAFDVMPVG